MAFIRIARITRPQGLTGLMRVEVTLDDDRVFEPGRSVTLRKDGKDPAAATIEFTRRQHGRFVIKLRSIDSIEAAEKVVGADIEIPESDLPPAETGTFYTFHLKGCRVTSIEGEELGTVTGVLDGGTQILRVEGEAGEILIPFAEAYLRKVDLEQRWIEVALPEGLRDLNS